MTSKAPVVGKCDVCGVAFEVQLREEPQPGGGVKIAFECPNGHRFEVAFISRRGVRLRDELNRLKAERNPANARQVRRLQERYEREYTGLATKQAQDERGLSDGDE